MTLPSSAGARAATRPRSAPRSSARRPSASRRSPSSAARACASAASRRRRGCRRRSRSRRPRRPSASSASRSASRSSTSAPRTSGRTQVVKQMTSGVAGLFKANGVEWVKGAGPLQGREHDRGRGRGGRDASSAAIVATGSFPLRPPIDGLDSPRCVDSTGLLAQTEVPRRLVVLGGGIIGCEFASIFRRFGSEVTIIEMLPKLIPMEDDDAAKELAKQFGKRGITLHLEKQCTRVEETGDGLRVHFGDGETVECDLMLVSVGRGAARRGARARGDRRRARPAQGNRRRRAPADDRPAHLRGRRLRRLLAARAHGVPRGRGRRRERDGPRRGRRQPRRAAADLHRPGDRGRRADRGRGARAVRRRRRDRACSRGSRTRAP